MDNEYLPSDHFVTIQTFSYPHEVAIIQAHLEAEGIECFIKDGLTLQVQPFYSNAIGGVKLQVKESDVERALDIMKASGYLSQDSAESKEAYTVVETTGSEDPRTGIRCPRCGSDEVSKPKLSQAAFAIGVLLLGFPLPFMSKTCHCFNCGHDFKKV